MLITRVSQLSGIERTLDLNVTDEEMWRWMHGMHTQTAFPNLTAGEREFIISGITSEEWDAAFPKDDEEPTEADCWDGDDMELS